MEFFKSIFKSSKGEKTSSIETEKNTLYAPLSGTVITLEEIDDDVFSAGLLGQGCGIRPSSETVTAPFDGKIIQIADTKHAIGIESTDGIEVLIHVGLDTVAMNGKGFTLHVKCGDQVKYGQKILTFDKSAIAASGYLDTTAVLITNSDSYQNIHLDRTGTVKSTEKLITVE